MDVHAIPVEGTVIGEAFVQRLPGRFDSLTLISGDATVTGPAMVLPLRATDAVAGVLVALRPVGCIGLLGRCPLGRRKTTLGFAAPRH